MVLLKKSSSHLYITYTDRIIQYNLNNASDIHVKIPKPTIPENLKEDQIKVLDKEVRNITSMELSASEDYILISTENKQIVIYDKTFKIIKNFVVNRAPSKACFTPSNDILVADKTGDVYLYNFKDEENKPVLLLGHLSVILDLAVSDCGKYIITCDRDEKIRVSHFPNCYNIASYCLGHTEFVTRIEVVKNILVSASGDGTLRFWNFLKGQQLSLIDTNSYIEEDTLLQSFCEEMNKEKVDIIALPITDIQIQFEGSLYIAVSIYKYEYIQVYNVDMSNFSSNLLTKIKVDLPFSFCLSNELCIFSNKFNVFKLLKNNNVEITEHALNGLYDKYRDVLKFDDTNMVTVLYKRKYDNVQEYLERKKQRL